MQHPFYDALTVDDSDDEDEPDQPMVKQLYRLAISLEVGRGGGVVGGRL